MKKQIRIYDPNKFLRRMAWVAGFIVYYIISAAMPGFVDGEPVALPWAFGGSLLTVIGIIVLADYLWERK